ncbi:winged helix-turn-helix domain-containing protein [Novosphingobium malaysiense]|uniref:winged helix-turn-helix domain-containing protein n=1 Tax=Novosphingobium malaysiense TaxID=1348853 RepID=UPI001E58C686|nr:winged helix-turn-helix domain-containing protein [Novosphingobium malaysiense]
MSIPDYQTLMLPVLSVAAEGERRVPIAADKIADQLGLSEEEREEMLPSGKQRLLHNRVHWAKFYMSKAGLIDTPRRGVFTASEAGKQLLATQPDRVDVEALKQYPAFAEFYGQSATANEPDRVPAATRATSLTPRRKNRSMRPSPFLMQR